MSQEGLVCAGARPSHPAGGVTVGGEGEPRDWLAWQWVLCNHQLVRRCWGGAVDAACQEVELDPGLGVSSTLPRGCVRKQVPRREA